jgi:predicted secreted Zn-dependent protease
MTKRQADRHLTTAYDHLLAAAAILHGERHKSLLSAIGTLRALRRELGTTRKGRQRAQTS